MLGILKVCYPSRRGNVLTWLAAEHTETRCLSDNSNQIITFDDKCLSPISWCTYVLSAFCCASAFLSL